MRYLCHDIFMFSDEYTIFTMTTPYCFTWFMSYPVSFIIPRIFTFYVFFAVFFGFKYHFCELDFFFLFPFLSAVCCEIRTTRGTTSQKRNERSLQV